jgi:FkbM family methyltransferase
MLSLMHTIRRVKWGVDSILDRCGYKLERKEPGSLSLFARLLHDRLNASKEILVFVQIGANDGVSSDPLYPLIMRFPGQFRGLVVEPLKDKFELLSRTYAHMESIIPVNVAIHNSKREMLIYRVRPELEKKLAPWARGLGSFDPEHHKRSRLDESYMMAERVNCTTFEELLAVHKISNIELLVTDTEGYDFEILRGIDLAKHRPTYIHFEHGLPSGVMNWEKYRELIRYMAQHGYNISHESHDATAFLPQALGP